MAQLQIGQAYGTYDLDQHKIIWHTTDSQSAGKIFNFEKEFIIGDNNQTYAIYYFGIQSLPGVEFTINSNKVEAGSIVRIGQTGIFELNLFDTIPIEQIKFENLLNKLSENGISDNVNYCLIDLIYEIRKKSEGGA